MKLRADWKVVRWETVKGVASNDFTRGVGLIPIAGYLILFNDEIAAMLSFDALAGVAGAEKSPFLLDGLTKLRLVFFGSLCLFCSFLTYRLFRPEVLEVAKSDLGSRLIDGQSQNMTVAARATAERKVFAHLS